MVFRLVGLSRHIPTLPRLRIDNNSRPSITRQTRRLTSNFKVIYQLPRRLLPKQRWHGRLLCLSMVVVDGILADNLVHKVIEVSGMVVTGVF